MHIQSESEAPLGWDHRPMEQTLTLHCPLHQTNHVQIPPQQKDHTRI